MRVNHRLTSQAHECLCGRILLPTRDHLWPHHYADTTNGVWCPISGKPVRR